MAQDMATRVERRRTDDEPMGANHIGCHPTLQGSGYSVSGISEHCTPGLCCDS